MNVPTNGRIIHYFPTPTQVDFDRTQPKAAMIVHVHSPDLVNLTVFTQHGHTLAHKNVKLYPDGSFVKAEERAQGGFAMWPEREPRMVPTQEFIGRQPEQAESGNG